MVVIWLSALSFLCRGDYCFGFVPCLLCRGGCWREELCTPNLVLVIPRGGSLCGRSSVDIVKILLCEGGYVEQWLEPQNISRCLSLIHYLLTLSLSLISFIALSCSYHT